MADKKRISLKVKPNSGESRIDFDQASGTYTAFLKSPPEKGKANKELLNLAMKRFGTRAAIVSGKTGRRKVIELF